MKPVVNLPALRPLATAASRAPAVRPPEPARGAAGERRRPAGTVLRARPVAGGAGLLTLAAAAYRLAATPGEELPRRLDLLL